MLVCPRCGVVYAEAMPGGASVQCTHCQEVWTTPAGLPALPRGDAAPPAHPVPGGPRLGCPECGALVECAGVEGAPVQCGRCGHRWRAVAAPAPRRPLHTCPGCSAVYMDPVPDSALIQCTRCGRVWRAAAAPAPGKRLHTCPGCSTIYMDPVPDGAAVQCTRCGRVWSAEPEAPPRPDPLAPLFERVHAAPDDDEARLVLADALTERGDPLGEFIVIQLGEPGGRARGMARVREVALRLEQGPVWLPPGVQHRTARFRRGFPQDVVLVGPTDPAHPGWWTVERLRVETPGDDLRPGRTPIGGRVRPALKVALGCPTSLVLELCASTPPRLEHLGFSCSRTDLDRRVLPALARLPALKVLEVDVRGEPSMPADVGPAVLWELLRQHGARLERLRLPLVSMLPGDVQAAVARDAPKAVVELRYHAFHAGEAWIRVTARRMSLHVRGAIPARVAEAMGAQLWRSGLREVEFHDEEARTHWPIPLGSG